MNFLSNEWTIYPNHDIYLSQNNVQRLLISKNQKFKACVPGLVHSILESNGVLPNLTKEANDTKYRDIFHCDWTFENEFSVPDFDSTADINSDDTFILVMNKVELVCDVFINDYKIGSCNNSFVKYTFFIPLKYLLSSQQNILKLTFQSPCKYAQQQSALYPYELPGGYVEVLNGERFRNFLRINQSSFGWDWYVDFLEMNRGPCIIPIGIGEEIYLTETKGYSDVVSECYVRVNLFNADEFAAHIKLVGFAGLALKFKSISVVCKIDEIEFEFDHGELARGPFNIEFTFTIPRNMVELWYPIGYGKSKLYNLKIDVYDVEMHMCVFSKTIPIGFRYSELDMEGKFVISVNGRKVFCKGANIVPIDLNETKVSKERLEKIIRKCVSANMNCIRVWGGGTYLPDFFYELCDEYGIMVWQECMFGNVITRCKIACAMYPTNSEFLENVEREIEYQSNRLGRFACIVLWSGNNENEEILVKGWFEPVKRNPFLYSIDYYILNNCILDSLRSTGYVGPYVSSSPSNGCFLNDPRRERFAQLPYTGDTHYYNYEDDARDTSKLPITNFASEFGYQSMPNYHDLRKVVECTDDLNFFSDFMIQRNHHLNGQTQMMNLMQKVFPFISECDEFEFQVYSSQIVQGWMLQSQIDHYRRLQFEGNCLGALYWQLNDVWTCPSWSTLTENGGCKLSYYFIKRAFEPIRITMHKVGNKLVVWMINDTDEIIDGVVGIEIYGMTVEKTILEVKMDARRGKKIVEMNYFNQSFLRAKFRHKDGNILAEEDFAEITSRNRVAPLVKVNNESITIQNTTENALYYVSIVFNKSNCEIELLENCFHLAPNEKKDLKIQKPISLSELKVYFI